MSERNPASAYEERRSRQTDSAERGRPIALVAVGGHAFMEPGGKGTIEEHERSANRLCDKLMTLIERGYELVITHGNGPQVGSLLLQQEAAQPEVPAMPLDVLVAQTEGSLGYILQQALLNHLRRRDISRYVVTVVTQVLVNEHDEAFSKPTKPIGPFLSKEEAQRRARELGWTVVDDAGRGWRRVVPSPHPIKVIQRHMIRDAARQGHIVLACGGGGVPIIEDSETGAYRGLEAVIDKDLTSSVLASQIDADLFIILTAVPQVYMGFGTPEQRALGAVTLQEIERLREEGHFPAGSMGPKIDAIIDFLKQGGVRGLITDPASLSDALEGRAGTHFVGRI